MALKVKTSVDGSGFARGLEKMNEDAANFGKGLSNKIAGNFGQAVMGIVPGLTSAIAGVFAADTLKQKIQDFADDAHKITMGALRLNIDDQTYQRLNNVLEETGHTAEDAASAFDYLAESVAKINSGSQDAALLQTAFANLGLTLEDMKSKDYQGLFFKIASNLQDIKPSADQIAALKTVFGRGGVDLLPAMQTGFNSPLANKGLIASDDLAKLEEWRNMRNQDESIFTSAWHGIATGAIAIWTAAKMFTSIPASAGRISVGHKVDTASDFAVDRTKEIKNHVAELTKKKIAQDETEKAHQKQAEARAKVNAVDSQAASQIDRETAALRERNRLAAMTPEQKRLELLKEIASLTEEMSIRAAHSDLSKTDEARIRQHIEQNRGQLSELNRQTPMRHPSHLWGNSAIGGIMLGHDHPGDTMKEAVKHLASIDKKTKPPPPPGRSSQKDYH